MITLKKLLTEVQNRCFETPTGSYMSNPDPKYKRLVTFANQAVRKILDAHDWNYLIKKHVINVVDGQDSYELPADFYRMIADTTYREGSYFPVTFPVTDQAMVRAERIGGNNQYYARFKGGYIEFQSMPPGDVSFEYVSNGLIKPNTPNANFSVPYTIDFSTDGDIFMEKTTSLDELLILGTQALYMRARGAEGADIAVADYTYQLKQQIFNDTGARTLNDVQSKEGAYVLWRHNPDYTP